MKMAVDHRGIRLNSTIEAIGAGESGSCPTGADDDSHSCRRQKEPLPHFSPWQSLRRKQFQGHSARRSTNSALICYGNPDDAISRPSEAVSTQRRSDKIVSRVAGPCAASPRRAAPVVRCTVGGPSPRRSAAEPSSAISRRSRHHERVARAGVVEHGRQTGPGGLGPS